jgi:uncharacterized membrane protein HdeD (DUF308 family)
MTESKSCKLVIIMGSMYISIFILSLFDKIRPTDFLLLLLGLLVIIPGIFNFTKNNQKKLYRLIMTVITVSMLIIFYRYSFYEETLNLIFLGGLTLFSIILMYFVPKEWKTRKELEKHDEVIE